MSVIHEIVLPEAKPDYQWVRGRAVQKMSPASLHSFVQSALLEIVRAWARAQRVGYVGAEWRVRILPEGSDERRPLTPDVAYFSRESLVTIRGGSERDHAFPPLAPDIAFEVVSDTDERADIEAKRGDYLGAGSLRVVEVYPQRRALLAWHSPTSCVTARVADTWTDTAFPDLAIRVADLFVEYDQYLGEVSD